MDKYIHYGHDHFDRNLFKKPTNYGHLFTKPDGGLWASRIGCAYGWKDYCHDSYFQLEMHNSFTFTLSDNANVVYLYDVEDLLDLPFDIEKIRREYPLLKNTIVYDRFIEDATKGVIKYKLQKYYIDFEKCIENGVDAIEICDITNLYYPLYGWDCESIIILNPDIVIPEKETS